MRSPSSAPVVVALVLSCGGAAYVEAPTRSTEPLTGPQPAPDSAPEARAACDPKSLLGEVDVDQRSFRFRGETVRDAGHFSLDPEKDVSLGMVEDLNGDGRLDFVLNYRVNYLTVGQAWASKMFATTNDDTCYVEVYHGQGPEVSPETANGWRRLTVDLLIREWPNGSIGWGAVRMVIEFSGDRYEWQGVDRCTFPEEKTQLGPLEIASECNGVLGRAPQRGDTMFEFDAMDSH